MLHDANEYHDPFSFNPDRFLGKSELDSTTLAFGFGRRWGDIRIKNLTKVLQSLSRERTCSQQFVYRDGDGNCNSRHLEGERRPWPWDRTSMWLHTEYGEVRLPKYVTCYCTLDIFYSHPLPFETCITPRSEKAIALIRDALEERGVAEWRTKAIFWRRRWFAETRYIMIHVFSHPMQWSPLLQFCLSLLTQIFCDWRTQRIQLDRIKIMFDFFTM